MTALAASDVFELIEYELGRVQANIGETRGLFLLRGWQEALKRAPGWAQHRANWITQINAHAALSWVGAPKPAARTTQAPQHHW